MPTSSPEGTPPQAPRGRLRPPLLRPVAGRRRRRGPRSDGLFNFTRLAGALVMLGASASLNWLTAPDHFRLDPEAVTVEGLRYTDQAHAVALLTREVDHRPNLFRLRTQSISRSLENLPAVARVDVAAALPDALDIRVIEREPVMVWQVDTARLMVDADGVVFSPVAGSAEDLPLVVDRRTGAEVPPVGERLDSIDLSAALRLAALTPELVESRAGTFSLEVEDENGWLLSAQPLAWRAAFGHYTPNLRPPTIIDQQVQCLRSLLAQNESQVAMIFLSPAEDRCGTFRARHTPGARIFQNVRRSLDPLGSAAQAL